ncbi:hypothetical protein M8C21_000886 [Ambrosia artemisiifolia]|uniref:Uncharacterized protein n=1 Tax=Ambrosia artemisiifolia TaxID=4212 RepID=A0AAD5CBE4_AMBAR|nr:hypothetical protein M8C21_000886 [Ambrosia artemisiifolia]
MVIGTRSCKRQHVELSPAGALVCLPYDVQANTIDVGSSTPVLKAIKKLKRTLKSTQTPRETMSVTARRRPPNGKDGCVGENIELALRVAREKLAEFKLVKLGVEKILSSLSSKHPNNMRVVALTDDYKKSLSFAREDAGETSKTLDTPSKRMMDVVPELGECYGIVAMSNVAVDVQEGHVESADVDSHEIPLGRDASGDDDVLSDSSEDNDWLFTRVGAVGQGSGGHPENDPTVGASGVPVTGILSNTSAGVIKQSDPIQGDTASNISPSKNVAMNIGVETTKNESAVPTSLGLGFKQALVHVVQWCGEMQSTLAGAMGAHRKKLGLACTIWKPDAGVKDDQTTAPSQSSFTLGLTQDIVPNCGAGAVGCVEDQFTSRAGKKYNEGMAGDLVVNMPNDVAGEKLSGDQMLRIMVRGALLATKILSPHA